MEFEPGIEEYIRTVHEALGTWPKAVTPEERRARFERYAEVHKKPYPPNIAVRDWFICAPGREIPIRIYRPDGDGPKPAILYFHGGGWVAGSISTHDTITAGLASKTGAQVVSVHYRRPPENPYPAPTEDCYYALCWVAENAGRLDADASRLAVAGDSAGGNLAAACTLMARDRSGPALRLQVIICPSLDTDVNSGSYLNAQDPFLIRENMIFYLESFLEGKLDTKDAYAVPMRAEDLSGLPPAYVLNAEHDPLRDEGLRYGERLKQAGVPTENRDVPGVIHGFLRARFVSKVAEREFDDLCAAVRTALDIA